jgi:glycosyltransferase involved in cell wall biosynthesis
MTEPRLTALIIARDEEAQLSACLDALAWADEAVVVVDAASGDATEAIARARADRVLVRDFDDFASQRNAALALATGEWVFAVDADERATPALANEVRSRVADPSSPCVGYRVPIRSTVFGRPFRGSGTQRDRPLRLFRRDAGRWVGAVHETVAIDGPIGRLRHHLTHQTHESLSIYLDKLNAYTTLEAHRLYEAGVRPRLFDQTLRPLWTFLKLYFGRLGFLDGPEGFAFCALSAVSVGVRNGKLRELARHGRKPVESIAPAAPGPPCAAVGAGCER